MHAWHSHARGALAAALSILWLVACSAGQPQSVTVTSHTDGDRIFGERAVIIEGVAEGVASVVVLLGGTEMAQVDVVDGAFAVPLVLGDNANEIRVEALGGGVRVGLELVYPWVDVGTFRPLDVVLGQPDPSQTGTGVGPWQLGSSPHGVVAFVGGVLYVPDPINHRVLGYLGLPTTHGAPADFVLGQATFGANTRNDDDQDGVADAAPSARTMYTPTAVASDGERLVVADSGNRRLLVFDSLPTTSFASASVVVGQGAMDETVVVPCSLDRPFQESQRVVVGGGRLVVPDRPGNRVLVWNQIPTTNGVPADLVVGQPGAGATCVFNDDDQDGVGDLNPSARTLSGPWDAWTDGERLLVADTSNHRVLLWQTFPSDHFAPADIVIGQQTMDTRDSGSGASMFDDVEGIASNGNQIAVADYFQKRVLVFDEFPASNFPAADHVLGQASFTHTTPNDDDQDGAPDATPSARTVGGALGAWMGEGVMTVSDYDNNRYALFVD